LSDSEHTSICVLIVDRLNCAVQAQRFVNIVLLPHVRRDIRDNRRLHFALFQSLKKACYKPDAFYKVTPASQCPLDLMQAV
jgi:Bystin